MNFLRLIVLCAAALAALPELAHAGC